MKRLHNSILMFALILGLVACAKAPTWQEQYDLGVRYLSEGNYQEAIIAFTAAIEIDPKQAVLYIGRAEAYIGSGETEENLAAALADYEKAVELDETSTEAWLGLADVYIRQGEFDKAEEVLKQALEKTSNAEAISAKLAEFAEDNIADAPIKIQRYDNCDNDGTLNWYHTYTYDENGRRTTVTSYDGAGNQASYGEFEYDNSGRVTVGYGCSLSSGKVRRIEFEYDGNGNRTSITQYNSDNTPDFRLLCEYNANGDCVRIMYYLATTLNWEQFVVGNVMDGQSIDEPEQFYRQHSGSNGFNRYSVFTDGTVWLWQGGDYFEYGGMRKETFELNKIFEQEYDTAGNVVRYTTYYGSGGIDQDYAYEYDSAGNQTRRTSYDGDGTVRWYKTYEYDSEGKTTRITEYDGGGNVIQVDTY